MNSYHPHCGSNNIFQNVFLDKNINDDDTTTTCRDLHDVVMTNQEAGDLSALGHHLEVLEMSFVKNRDHANIITTTSIIFMVRDRTIICFVGCVITYWIGKLLERRLLLLKYYYHTLQKKEVYPQLFDLEKRFKNWNVYVKGKLE